MSSTIRIESHRTDPNLYANLARVFGEQENNGTRWTRFQVEEVELIFFAPTPSESAVADAFTPPNPLASVKA